MLLNNITYKQKKYEIVFVTLQDYLQYMAKYLKSN